MILTFVPLIFMGVVILVLRLRFKRRQLESAYGHNI